MQRIPRYVLLLQQLQKYTLESDPSYSGIFPLIIIVYYYFLLFQKVFQGPLIFSKKLLTPSIPVLQKKKKPTK